MFSVAGFRLLDAEFPFSPGGVSTTSNITEGSICTLIGLPSQNITVVFMPSTRKYFLSPITSELIK